MDWLLENLLVFLFVPLTIWGYMKNRISTFSFTLIVIFLLFHAVGAHYTYSEVPFGHLVAKKLNWERNSYDRFVHLLSGLLLTVPFREVLEGKIRTTRFGFAAILFCFMATLGVLYEIIEWATAAVVEPAAGTAFLGTQGDEWDAQKDIALKLLGTTITLLLVIVYEKRRSRQHVTA